MTPEIQPPNSPSDTPAWSSDDLRSNPHEAHDKAKRVEAMFTSIARSYDLNNRLHSLLQDQIWRYRAVQMANLNGEEDVVDIACGTGDLAMAFCKAGVHSVIGIDFTQAMLDIAKSKATIANLDIDYVLGNAEALDIPDYSVDVVSIAFGIRNVQNQTKAYAEFFRVLRPGGRLIVLEFSSPPNKVIRAIHNVYTKHIMPLTATMIAKDTSGAYKYLAKSVETFDDPDEIANAIEEAGFQSVSQKAETFGVCTITRGDKHFT